MTLNRLVLPLLLILAPAPAFAACASVATTEPTPPRADDLYPARLLRVAKGPADGPATSELFAGTRNNDGAVSREIFAAPMPTSDSRRRFRLREGRQLVQVIESIPNDALTQTAASDRRRMGVPQAKTLTIDVEPGQEYAIAARLVPGKASRTRGNAHWEPVVWRTRAVACKR